MSAVVPASRPLEALVVPASHEPAASVPAPTRIGPTSAWAVIACADGCGTFLPAASHYRPAVRDLAGHAPARLRLGDMSRSALARLHAKRAR